MKKFRLADYNDVIEDWSVYENLTPRERILAYCHQCCCYQSTEVKLCPAKSCPLWDFKEKYYRSPRHSGMSEDKRKEASIRMKNTLNNIRANKQIIKTYLL